MALTRRDAIMILIGLEFMLNAANLNFIAFWRFSPGDFNLSGVILALFVIAIAAVEAGVGLALIIGVHRHFKTTNLDKLNSLKG
jgi:NADH-quinone oxidoreductase subunit K